jgi:hypothetical protein
MLVLEGNPIVPRSEMTVAGVEKRSDWDKNTEIKRPIPRKAGGATTIETLQQNREHFAS